jgi:primary-amine oxidase
MLQRLVGRDGAEATRILNNDPRWRAALARRHLQPSDVRTMRMGPGDLQAPWARPGGRYVRLSAALRSAASPYAAPIEGVVAIVDLTTLRVVDVIDAEPNPPPLDSATAVTRDPGPSARPLRFAFTPRAYHVSGQQVAWLGWTFQFAMDPRDGLVLYDVSFAPQGGPPRRVLARAGLSEMLVPYGDPSPAWSFRSVFDAAEYGVGRAAATLIPGRDLPADATRFDAVLATEAGRPQTLRGVIGVYERDGGLRWRHDDTAERARELVMRSVTTVGNYDYGFSWVFSQDGGIAMEVDLTGVMFVKGVHHADPGFGTAVTPHLSAIDHQHFFNFRLDFDIDGSTNRVREIETRALPMDSTNPLGTAFATTSTVLAREGDAARDLAPERSRSWVIENPRRADSLGGAPGYMLLPGPLPALLAAPNASLSRRGAFAKHALWVTRWKESERHAAGAFPGQDSLGSGLPAFVADNEPIDGTDIVVWYNIGITHVPRPEEWPLMPVHRIAFELRPVHFLTPVAPDPAR